MSGFKRLYRGENDYDFRKLWRIGVPLSIIFVILSIVSLATRELNLGIDFEGGGVWEVPAQDFSVGEARDAMGSVGESEAKIQTLTNSSGDTIVRIQAGADSVNRSGEITETLADAAGIDANEIGVSTVGPSWGKNITDKAVRALVVFFVILGIYIALTLEWRMAIGALIAVAHDIIISVGVYSIFQIEVTPPPWWRSSPSSASRSTTPSSCSTRCRRTRRASAWSAGPPTPAIMNLSLNQTLMRSINTTLVTIVPVLSILLIGAVLLGAVTLEEFGFALLVGLISGAYSSVFVAASRSWPGSRSASPATERCGSAWRRPTAGRCRSPASATASSSSLRTAAGQRDDAADGQAGEPRLGRRIVERRCGRGTGGGGRRRRRSRPGPARRRSADAASEGLARPT